MIDQTTSVRQSAEWPEWPASRWASPRGRTPWGSFPRAPGAGRRRRCTWSVRLALLALPVLSVGEGVAQETVTITGRVVDAVTGEPIPGVAVTLAPKLSGLPSDLEFETDGAGQFEIPDIALGGYRLELAHPRYNPTVGDFTVVREGSFEARMQPAGQDDGELITGIVGVVTDAESGDLLSGATVHTGGGQTGSVTDLRGEFLLDKLIPGQYVIESSLIGYAPRADTITVTAGRVTNVQVALSVDPVELDPLEVSVERREVKLQEVGFYHRRHTGFGKYIDRQEIEERGPSEVTDLFIGMAGVELYRSATTPLDKWVVLRMGRLMWPSRTLAETERGETEHLRCFPTVYVDGLLSHSGGGEPARLDDFLDPMAIAGLEVYPSTTGLPPRYQGTGARCGVILVWTRVTGRTRDTTRQG